MRQVGDELGIRYALGGSVQRSGTRLRVNVELIDTESGGHLWAERFDRDTGELFDTQDEIVARVARALDVELTAAEARRAERGYAADLDSIDFTFRGYAAFNRSLSPENLTEADQFFETALTLDPRNAQALVGRALASFAFASSYTRDERATHLATAETAAIQALALAPNYAKAHRALGEIYIYTNRTILGIAELEQAIALDRNHAHAYAMLMGLLTFVRSAHYWTVLHPEIRFEEDIIELLRFNDELRQVLLEDPKASRCDMGSRLFSELESLRELHEKRELEKANRELRQRAEEGELLRQEINHRVKNSLQIVSSVLHLQVPLVKDSVAAEALRNTEARVMAIAAVHERLYKDTDDIRSMKFDSFLRDLCTDIARAYGVADGIVVEAQPIVVSRDQAISMALIVNELVTNVFRHAGPPCQVTLQDDSRRGFKVTVSDTGKGPAKGEIRKGLGTRMIGALVQQLNATLETKTDPRGYHCELFVPHPR